MQKKSDLHRKCPRHLGGRYLRPIFTFWTRCLSCRSSVCNIIAYNVYKILFHLHAHSSFEIQFSVFLRLSSCFLYCTFIFPDGFLTKLVMTCTPLEIIPPTHYSFYVTRNVKITDLQNSRVTKTLSHLLPGYVSRCTNICSKNIHF